METRFVKSIFEGVKTMGVFVKIIDNIDNHTAIEFAKYFGLSNLKKWWHSGLQFDAVSHIMQLPLQWSELMQHATAAILAAGRVGA